MTPMKGGMGVKMSWDAGRQGLNLDSWRPFIAAVRFYKVPRTFRNLGHASTDSALAKKASNRAAIK